ncbi:MAG: response regulator [Chloroflexota bacterium]
MERQNILIVDDEPAITQSLKRNLRDDYEVFTANTVADALEIVKNNEIAVIITDQRMPDMQGVDFLMAAKSIQPNSLSVLLSGYSDVQALVRALNIKTVRGFIPKPWDNEFLMDIVKDAAKEYRVVFKNSSLMETYSQAISELQLQLVDFKKIIENISLGVNLEVGSQEWRDQQDIETNSVKNLYLVTDKELSASMLGLLPLRETNKEKFESLKLEYMNCLEKSLEQRLYDIKFPIASVLKTMANEFGFLRAGPRDVIEVHHAALMASFEKHPLPRRQVYITVSRLLVLELMGNLVQYYRSYSLLPKNHSDTSF